MRKLWLALPIALLAVPGSALGAERYASPNGDGDCSQNDPCSIVTAINSGSAGDEVIVNPGTYEPIQQLVAKQNMSIHGVAGQQRPLISTARNGSSAVLAFDDGAELSHMDFTQAGGTAGSGAPVLTSEGSDDGFEVTDVSIEITPYDTGIVALGTSLITNTVIAMAGSSGSGAVGVFVSNATVQMRNDTIVGTAANSTAVQIQGDGGSASVTAISVIARGGSNGNDFDLIGVPPSNATLFIGSSNSRGVFGNTGNSQVNDLGGNLMGVEPAFVDAAGGDFRMLPTSPTIDQGIMYGETPTTDADGKPRPIGPAADIGAYEYGFAPSVSTGSASVSEPTVATVTGAINTNDSNSSYHFDYGTTTAYGSATSENSLFASLTGGEFVSSSLSGLEPGTTYHYRLVSTNELSTTIGSDATFKTPPAPAPPARFDGVDVPTQTVKVSKRSRSGKLELRCPVTADGSCSGKATIDVKRKLHRTTLKVTKTVSFNIPRNKTARVSFKLSKRQYRVLRKSKRLKGTLKAVARDDAGQSRTTRGKLTLKR